MPADCPDGARGGERNDEAGADGSDVGPVLEADGGDEARVQVSAWVVGRRFLVGVGLGLGLGLGVGLGGVRKRRRGGGRLVGRGVGFFFGECYSGCDDCGEGGEGGEGDQGDSSFLELAVFLSSGARRSASPHATQPLHAAQPQSVHADQPHPVRAPQPVHASQPLLQSELHYSHHIFLKYLASLCNTYE